MQKIRRNVTAVQFGILEALKSGKADGSREWLESINKIYIHGLIKSGCLQRHFRGVVVTKLGKDIVDNYHHSKSSLPYLEHATAVSKTLEQLLAAKQEKVVHEIKRYQGTGKRVKVA